MPKISIIIPTYNVKNYLKECLDSVINQTLKDTEIICVNDGSNDGSLNILEMYASKDNRIKIINKQNSGYGHTMNVGIDNANGEFIGIVEPDDFISLNMYDDLYKIAKEKQADIVKADFYRFITRENKIIRTYNQLTNCREYYNRIIDPYNEIDIFYAIMNTWSGIYRTAFLKENKIRHNETPGASFQDNGFWFQGFCLSHNIYFVDKPYYMNRRDNPNSSVYDKGKVYALNKEYDFIKEFLVKNYLWDHFKNIYMLMRWQNCCFTYNRIAKQYKLEYLKNISNELKESLQDGLINENYFSSKQINIIKNIARSPILFYFIYRKFRRIKKL